MISKKRMFSMSGVSLFSLLLVLTLMVGCSQSAPKQAASPSAAPSASAQPQKTNDPLAEFAKTVEAAKKEGKIVISGPPSESWRTAVMTFNQDYPDIKIEFTPGNSRDFWPKAEQEQGLGQFLWDIRIGGSDISAFSMIGKGGIEPIRPLLVLPEVTDNSKWFGGLDKLFADNKKQFFPSFTAYEQNFAYVNRDFISTAEVNSDKDLLDPKWKGKIAMQDPRGGAGLVGLGVMVKAYGEEYVRDLLSKQEIIITKDNRQQLEWAIRGRYPIGIGLDTVMLADFQTKDLGKNVINLEKGAKMANNGFGGLQLLKSAPHPNASKVFINWILTQKAQEKIMPIIKSNSLRLDVKPGDPSRVLKEGAQYFWGQHEEGQPSQQIATKLINELIK